LAAAISLKLAVKRTADGSAHSDVDNIGLTVSIWRMPIAWAIAFFNFIHVGFESGMGGWLTTYTGRVEGEPVIHWLSPTLLYFLFFVLGRGVAPLLFRFFNENQMLFLGLAFMLGGITLTLIAGTVVALGVGAAVAGFGTSWIFPTNISRFSKTFGPAANRRATPLFAAGTLGAAAVTWLIGFLSDKTGDLRSGMFVLGFSVVILILLQIALAIRGRTKVQLAAQVE
jgi:fucose permease